MLSLLMAGTGMDRILWPQWKCSLFVLFMSVAPGPLTMIPDPSGMTTWKVNDVLKMTCNGPLGTVEGNMKVTEFLRCQWIDTVVVRGCNTQVTQQWKAVGNSISHMVKNLVWHQMALSLPDGQRWCSTARICMLTVYCVVLFYCKLIGVPSHMPVLLEKQW